MTKKKIALIFGITGQDGSYLAKLLLKKNYTVYGVRRKISSINSFRYEDIYVEHQFSKNFFLLYGDLTDQSSIINILNKVNPSEIYNLAAQSHVEVSFQNPESTSNINALGCLRILEGIRILNLKKVKFYQAGTSELFGSSSPPQNENTKMIPQSPYAASKLFAHWITIIYRQSYSIFASNGILFNHESPFRGYSFVTKKIISSLCKIIFSLEIYIQKEIGVMLKTMSMLFG